MENVIVAVVYMIRIWTTVLPMAGRGTLWYLALIPLGWDNLVIAWGEGPRWWNTVARQC